MIAPFCIPPLAAVYVKVIVRPVWDAETVEVELVSVPAPSTASGGINATRWATQGVDAEMVAVVFPVAPTADWIPSAPTPRALLVGALPDVMLYSSVRPWPASWLAVTVGPDWPWTP